MYVSAHAHHLAVPRALVLAALVAAGLQVALGVLLRDARRGALLASGLVILAAGWREAWDFVADPGVDARLIALTAGSLVVLGLVVLRLLLLLLRRAGRTPIVSTGAAHRALATVAGLWLLAVVVGGALQGAAPQLLRELARPPAAAPIPANGEPPPDIYLIIFDSHGRRDSLQRLFGYDTGPFLGALTERGFSVAERSRATYPATVLVLPSMFHMRFVEDIAELRPVIEGRVDPAWRARNALAYNPAFEALREAGYELVASLPPFEDASPRTVDRILDDGQINEFEYALLRRTAAFELVGALVPDFMSEQQRSRMDAQFRHVAEVAGERSPRPRFMFVHVPAPHLPAVFHADGSPRHAPITHDFYDDTASGLGITVAEYGERYTGQVEHIDRRVVELVDQVLERSARPPVIVLMGDHGPRAEVTWSDIEAADFDAALPILFAALTPGREDLFPGNVTSVNVLSILMNAYLGTEFPALPPRTFIPGRAVFWTVQEVPNPDG